MKKHNVFDIVMVIIHYYTTANWLETDTSKNKLLFLTMTARFDTLFFSKAGICVISTYSNIMESYTTFETEDYVNLFSDANLNSSPIDTKIHIGVKIILWILTQRYHKNIIHTNHIGIDEVFTSNMLAQLMSLEFLFVFCKSTSSICLF
eukprot:130521_1